MKELEKKVLSSDKQHLLIGKVYLPETEPKGLFHVVHGMQEYIGRYDSFMKKMCEEGYIVFGYDHLGHGLTGAQDNVFGYIAEEDGWKLLVDDVNVFATEIRNEYGKDLPYTLMGHSMGSFIVRLAEEKFKMCDHLIIMGTGGPNPIAKAGLALSKGAKKRKGAKAYSTTLEKAIFGSYNKKFADENCVVAWLTKDQAIKDKYLQDPFCTYHFTVSAINDLINLTMRSNEKKWAENIRHDIKILLVSGCDDPVGNYGKGVKAVYDMLVKAGADAQIKLYENCRHEILNDTCKEEVITDILNFIAK